MKKDIGKALAVFRMPVLMVGTYDENGTVDVMNCAWGHICDYDKIILFLGEDRKTVANLRVTKAFTVALADRDHIKEADYFGIVSGNKTPDKFARSGLHAEKSELVQAPIIQEFPVVMECELAEIVETETVFGIVGTIRGVKAEESVLDEKGKVDVTKLNALMFDQFRNDYYTVGEKAGQAWNAGVPLSKSSD